PVAAELRAQRRDLDVGVAVAPLPSLDGRLEEPEALEVAQRARGDARPGAELVGGELLVLVGERGGARLPLRALDRRRELLADHPERQELVPLEAEDRLQAVDVVVAEQPVAARRPARRQ